MVGEYMELLKLDIQKFSGGSYDYKFYVVDEYYNGRMYDLELNELIKDLVPILKSVEWWQSADTSEENYRKDVAEFKKKWFGTPRKDRLKTLIDKHIEETKKELYQLIGLEVNE